MGSPTDPKGWQTTYYGYKGDSTGDYNSLHRIGASWNKWGPLQKTPEWQSVAMSDQAGFSRGLKHNEVFHNPGDPQAYRWQDIAPYGYRDKQGQWHQYTTMRFDKFDPDYSETYNPVRKKRKPTPLANDPDQASATPVTINNHVTYNISGDHDGQKLAEQHRKHIEHMKKTVAEVLYEHNRRAFSSTT